MKLPVLYSFRRCPYAMRARWALLQAGLLVEWREVALRHKPECLRQASPKATVPVLVTADGNVIDESLAIMRWALHQADPSDWLGVGLAADQQEAIAALIAENDGVFKHHLDRFKYTDRYPGASRQEHQHQGEALLEAWSARIATAGWLVGERCSLADAALWPFVRQWRIADPAGFDHHPALGPLRQWLQVFLEAPGFDRLMNRIDPWQPGDPQRLFPGDAAPVDGTQPLFHLALADDWAAAQASGSYRISTLGLRLEQVGFIHASQADQVAGTYQRFYADAGEVVLLSIDPQRLQHPLRADPTPGGELFPHLYGPLPISAVTAVNPYPSSSQ